MAIMIDEGTAPEQRPDLDAGHMGSFDINPRYERRNLVHAASGSLLARKGFLAWVHADRLRFVVSQSQKRDLGTRQALNLGDMHASSG
jgi:hypothetical protein